MTDPATDPTPAPTPGPAPAYRAVPAQVDLPAMEREILAFWHEHKTFDRSLAQTAGGPRWTFYEGPPTANGQPGTHHVEARVFKDVFPRFKTMKGFLVERKAGWDCHGLPVEIAVEKELGFSGKQDIEAYGVDAFNARCRESVLRHVDEFERMTLRMGYWVDMSQAYWTMDASYVESVWWSLKHVFDQGLLVQDHRVTPYCPRCGTGLSDHELAQGYEQTVDPSVFVRMPLTSGPLAGQADLLVWTTTPWTLVSNTAVAVHPEVEYVLARGAEDGPDAVPLVVAEPLLAATLGEGAVVLQRFAGREMEHWGYQRPFELVEIGAADSTDPGGQRAHYVVLADYVTTEDGSGLVHQAPAFGADDLAVGRAYGLPVVNPVLPDGRFEEHIPLVGGVFFKDADERLVADLRERGLLFRETPYEHAYPHCWRCHTVLIYYAQPAWYIRTTAIKDQLLAENARTTWYPDTIKWGRYGDWLNNNIDWALSRDRYWGTPLPIWRCTSDESHLVCVGSRAELGELAGRDLAELDPHRPYVDDVVLACRECGAQMRRVPQVIDGWYDSGSMPFAQWGYPWAPGSAEKFARSFPADFICEAIDQTRGWFYTLMAVNTLVHGRSSYRNVLCLGHILAEDGRKMSKHLGNILEPMPLMDEHGADALRWFMLAGGSPWSSRRVGHASLQEVVRKTLLTYWNTVAFHALYARTAGWTPAGSGSGGGAGAVPAVEQRPLLDRWLVSELNQLTGAVDAALEDFDTHRAGRLLAEFIDDLSNWYVRRSRRRFWNGEPAALATLHETIDVLTRLLAPMVPFITERVWQDVVRPVVPDAAESVHLAAWPVASAELIDPKLSAQMGLVRRLVELGRAARAESKVRNRQPLGRALVGAAGWAALPGELRAQLAEELNVLAGAGLAAVGGELVDHAAKANFRGLGKRFGKQTPVVAAAIAAADAGALAHALRARGMASVSVPELGSVEVGPDDVIVTETPRHGWAVAADAGETVALDLELTPELRRAGLAREVIRLVQEARKSSGLEVSDRIRVWWTGFSDAVAEALGEHGQAVAEEVLAVSFEPVTSPPEFHGAGEGFGDEELGVRFWLAKV